jgi:pimeloyl-ACP methyl ester carboxylesterase
MRRSIVMVLLGTGLAGCAAPSVTTSFRTSDGYTVFADIRVPPGGARPAPLVVVSHQLDRDRRSWDPLVPRLLQAGYAVVAVDHRGFGESVREAASPALLSLEARGRLELDLLGAIRAAGARRGIDATRVAVIGTGVSATAAVHCARENPAVHALALLVGPLDLDAEEFLLGHPDFPLLMVAAAGDAAGTSLMRQYGERFTGPPQQYVEMQPVDASDPADWRGTDGLARDTGLADLLLWFLERNLPVRATATPLAPSGSGRVGRRG